jgi:hypothetical protein
MGMTIADILFYGQVVVALLHTEINIVVSIRLSRNVSDESGVHTLGQF